METQPTKSKIEDFFSTHATAQFTASTLTAAVLANIFRLQIPFWSIVGFSFLVGLAGAGAVFALKGGSGVAEYQIQLLIVAKWLAQRAMAGGFIVAGVVQAFEIPKPDGVYSLIFFSLSGLALFVSHTLGKILKKFRVEKSSVKYAQHEQLRAILQKSYARIPVTLLILSYVGLVIALIFIAIGSPYGLGSVVGVPTLQLLTSAISAGSAVASALAAILIWRGNAQARNRVFIDRILGPIYSEIRHTKELLETWTVKASEVAVNTPFLRQVASDWLYYTLDKDLRGELDNFQDLVADLSQRKDLCKTIASNILVKAASTAFKLEKVSTVYLWRSHEWAEGATHGENGRMPTAELIVDSPPLSAPSGYYVHLLQAVDFDGKGQYSLPLLNLEKEPTNENEFREFWELASKQATQDKTILAFRKLLAQAIAYGSGLESTFDSRIKRLR